MSCSALHDQFSAIRAATPLKTSARIHILRGTASLDAGCGAHSRPSPAAAAQIFGLAAAPVRLDFMQEFGHQTRRDQGNQWGRGVQLVVTRYNGKPATLNSILRER